MRYRVTETRTYYVESPSREAAMVVLGKGRAEKQIELEECIEPEEAGCYGQDRRMD
jgi:hypothetical protein